MKRKTDRRAPSAKVLLNRKGLSSNGKLKSNKNVGKTKKLVKVPRPTAKVRQEPGSPTMLKSGMDRKSKRELVSSDVEYEESVVTKKTKREALTRKEKKQENRIKKDSTGLQSELMEMYEELRRKNLSLHTKQKIIDSVLDRTEGKANDVIFKHDCVRVLEFCVKFGSEKQKERIFSIYKEHNIELLKSKYAKHLVKKLIKYGSKVQRNVVIKALHGNVKRLMRQKEASGVLEYIYHQFADSSQRASLIEEFYGPHYAVFKAAIGRKLEQIFEKEPDKKSDILRHMKEALVPLASKDSVSMTIIHKPLLEFFTFADGPLRAEMIESLREHTVHMVHTYEGSRVAMNCIWFGSTKDRKLIIKSFKPFVNKICMEEYGHLTLIAAFDSIDDTVFVTKTIISGIISQLDTLIEDQYGRKVIIYLLNARDKRFFTPHCIQVLQKGDDNPTSKKDKFLRQAELRKGILDPMLKYFEENIEEIIRDKSKCQVFLAAMEHSEESLFAGNIMKKIIQLISRSIDQEYTDEDHIVFHQCSHWIIKRLVQQDKARMNKAEDNIFSKQLINSISESAVGDWVLCNRGAFVVASLLESGLEEVVKFVEQGLKSVASQLKVGQTKGMDVVIKLLNSNLSKIEHASV